MHGETLTRMTVHTHLGLVLTQDLSWQDHINKITKKANNRLGIFKYIRWLFPRPTLITIYKSLVRPILEYADVIFDNCTLKQSLLLERVQRRAALLCTGAYRHTNQEKLLSELGWECLSVRRKKHRLIMLYKICNCLVPSYLAFLKPTTVSETTRYQLRNDTHLVLPRIRTQVAKNGFIYRSVSDWNHLDIQVRNIKSLSCFKKRITTLFKPTVNPLFNHGFGYSQVVLCRMRLGLCGLNVDLFKHNIVDAQNCPHCINIPETLNHYFFKCPLYATERYRMLGSIFSFLCPNVNPSLLLPYCEKHLLHIFLHGSPDIDLDGNKIIFSTIFIYIQQTKRFIR